MIWSPWTQDKCMRRLRLSLSLSLCTHLSYWLWWTWLFPRHGSPLKMTTVPCKGSQGGASQSPKAVLVLGYWREFARKQNHWNQCINSQGDTSKVMMVTYIISWMARNNHHIILSSELLSKVFMEEGSTNFHSKIRNFSFWKAPFYVNLKPLLQFSWLLSAWPWSMVTVLTTWASEWLYAYGAGIIMVLVYRLTASHFLRLSALPQVM